MSSLKVNLCEALKTMFKCRACKILFHRQVLIEWFSHYIQSIVARALVCGFESWSWHNFIRPPDNEPGSGAVKSDVKKNE